MRRALVALMLVAAACGAKAPPPETHATKTGAHPSGLQRGYATWYGTSPGQEGGPTASGERFHKNALTAAHRTLPMGTMVRVTETRTGRSVVVRINDRGPYGDHSRIIDLSEAAARQLGIIDAGVAPVTIEILSRP
jgi:rare lipoprotein A